MTAVRTVASRTIPTSGTWVLDPSHSQLSIIARHLMVTKVRGTFGEITGRIEVADDPIESQVEIEAKAASVTTGVPDRDAHLRSPDFLNAESYPNITFRSTEVRPAGDAWKLTGELTVRDVTRPITFDFTFDGATTDPFGNTKAAFTAWGEFEREAWGLSWNVPLEGGGVLVSKTFKVEFDVQAMLQS